MTDRAQADRLERITPRQAFHMALIVVVALVFFLPLYWLTMSSLRPEDDIFRYLNPFSWWTFFPNRLTFDNVIGLWTGAFARDINSCASSHFT